MQARIVSRTSITYPGATQSIFPGAAKLDDGTLLVHFVAGSDFESSDQQVVQARSGDNGKSWTVDGPIYDHGRLPFTEPFSDCAKPTNLGGGELLAVGYGFLRDRPEMGLSDYAESFGHFPKILNTLIYSHDNGASWSLPAFLEHGYDGLELSGPALRCADGRLLLFAAPFVLHAEEHLGLTFASEDNGRTWHQTGTFFRSPDIGPWEVRSCQLPSGRILLVIWTFDLKRQKHLPNRLIWSDDGGETWSEPFDTGLRGQASNFFRDGARVGLVQAIREGDHPGIQLCPLVDPEGDMSVGTPMMAWEAAGMANSQGNIETQFASLKFGQPSMIEIGDGLQLLLFWHFVDGRYSVQAWQLELR